MINKQLNQQQSLQQTIRNILCLRQSKYIRYFNQKMSRGLDVLPNQWRSAISEKKNNSKFIKRKRQKMNLSKKSQHNSQYHLREGENFRFKK
ncbi:unnamed protein product [Paramecium octaurelia]|uniref:Uncharacterized protein n=1 Tax=Paramecium octaurelia TaxID=43137 RepID=A0A8S1VIY4_PAROT|nr:unnamed protein product [Paramecium octaurelia]